MASASSDGGRRHRPKVGLYGFLARSAGLHVRRALLIGLRTQRRIFVPCSVESHGKRKARLKSPPADDESVCACGPICLIQPEKWRKSRHSASKLPLPCAKALASSIAPVDAVPAMSKTPAWVATTKSYTRTHTVTELGWGHRNP
jgi:hypothetical protein